MVTAKMNWQAFKQVLAENANKMLKFSYNNSDYVSAGYHITEIKKNLITSVDCGGVIKLVESKVKLDPLAIVKIEYGNAHFDTRQLLPARHDIEDNALVITLAADATQCKAQQRDSNACCGTEGVSKQRSVPCC